MDRRMIASLEPMEVARQASYVLADCLEKHEEQGEELLDALLPPWRTVDNIRVLECIVFSGGFHQFFWNPERCCRCREFQDDLRRVRATAHSELFARALETSRKYDYTTERDGKPVDWEALERGYEERRFEMLNEAFRRHEKLLSAYLGEYIKSRPDLYVGKPVHSLRGGVVLRRLDTD